MFTYLKKRPMLSLAISASVIIALANCFNGITIIAGILIIGACFVMLFKRKLSFILMFLVPLLIITLSLFVFQKRIDKSLKANGKSISGNFLVVNNPEDNERYNLVYIKPLSGEFKSSKISLSFKGDEISMGDIVSATVKLKSLNNKDYKNIFYASNVLFFGSAEDDIAKTGENGFYKFLYKTKTYITDTLFDSTDSESASTLLAIIIGDKSYLTEGFENCIKHAGLSHVMVVSGMHLSIIMSITVLLLERLFYNKYLKAFFTVIVTLFMCAVCGFTPSIIRAGLMYLAVALSFVLKQDNCSSNTLGLTVAVMYMFNPFYLFSLSFELSVLSTFGIITLSPFLLSFVKVKFRFAYDIISIAVCSLSALILTLPVTIYRFGGFSAVSLITNVLVSFAVTLALSITILGLILHLISPLVSMPAFFTANHITRYINSVINYFGGSTFSYIKVNPNSFIIGLAVLFVCFAVFSACNKQKYMIKLKQIRSEIVAKGGGKIKWRYFMKKN